MFSYNTSLHQSTNNTPFFLTFGMEPRAPHFPQPDNRRKFYGESSADELYHRLQLARQIATHSNELARTSYTHHHDKKVVPIRYHEGQLVLLDEYAYLHKNKKLAPKWSGPHTVTRIIHDTNVELKLANGRKTVVHVNRLKPYHFPMLMPPPSNSPPPLPLPQQQQQLPNRPMEEREFVNEFVNDQRPLTPNLNIPFLPDDNLVLQNFNDFSHEQIENVIPPTPKKRGRPPKGMISNQGRDLPRPRPRQRNLNQPLANDPQHEAANDSFNVDQQLVYQNQAYEKQVAPKDFLASVEKLPQIEQRLTRSQARQLLQLIKESDSEDSDDLEVQQILLAAQKARKRRKKNGTGDDRLQETRERNFKTTGDEFGTTVQVHRGGGYSPLHDAVEESSSESDNGGGGSGSEETDQDSDVENEDERDQEEDYESAEEIPAGNNRAAEDEEQQQPERDLHAMHDNDVPGFQQPGENVPVQQQQDAIQPADHPKPAGAPVGKDDQQIPPDKRLQNNDKMPERRRPPSPPAIPQPDLFAGRTKNVQDAERGAIPKHRQQGETTKPNAQKSSIDDQRARDQKIESPKGDQTKSKALPQNRNVASPNDVLTQNMQRIVGLLGKAFRETGEAERRETYQQLHDSIILAPVFVTIDDLPIKPEWKTKQAQDVFRSAIYYRNRRLESQRQARAQRQQEQEGKTPLPKEPQKGGTQGLPKPIPIYEKRAQNTPNPEQGRPTRSTTKAPDIPPTPPVPLERQSRKEPK